MVSGCDECTLMHLCDFFEDCVPACTRVRLEVPGESPDLQVPGYELDSPIICEIHDELLIQLGIFIGSEVMADMCDHARFGDAGKCKSEGDRVRPSRARNEGPTPIVTGMLVPGKGPPAAQDPRDELIASPVLGHGIPTVVLVPCIIHAPMIEWAIGE